MKKLLLCLFFAAAFITSKAQMISVSGGNLTLHKKDKGYLEVEVMADLAKKLTTHMSFTKTIGGYDMAMVGLRYTPWKNLVGLSLSACYMEKHDVKPMYGFDIQLSKQVRLALSSSFDSELRTIGLKIPVYMLKHDRH